jgi:hypothetical protein
MSQGRISADICKLAGFFDTKIKHKDNKKLDTGNFAPLSEEFKKDISDLLFLESNVKLQLDKITFVQKVTVTDTCYYDQGYGTYEG